MKPPNESPDAAEFGLLVAYLMTHKPQDQNPGEWNQEIVSIIGQPGDMTRAELVDALCEWMKGWAD